jgi:hypothetical protein
MNRNNYDAPAQYETAAAGVSVADPEKALGWYLVEFASLSWIEEIVADSSLPDWAPNIVLPTPFGTNHVQTRVNIR